MKILLSTRKHPIKDSNKYLLNLSISCTLLMCGLVSTQSHADAEDLSLGLSYLDVGFDPDIPNYKRNEVEASWKIQLSYQLMDSLALGVGYMTIGEIEEKTADHWSSLNFKGYTIGLTGLMPVQDRITFWGSIGYYIWDAEMDVQITSFTNFDDSYQSSVGTLFSSDTNYYAGFGVNFNLDQDWYFTLEYSVIENSNWNLETESGSEFKTSFDLSYIGIGIGAYF